MKSWFNRSSLLGLVALAIIGYLSVIVFQTVKHNYDLNSQISSLQAQISQLTVQQDELKYQVEYYKTDSFKEKEARAKLGLQQPGESVIILPKTATPAQPTNQKTTTKHQSNPKQWWEFLFG